MRGLLRRAAGSHAVRLAITAAILAWLSTRIDMGAAVRAVVAIDPVALALVLGLVALDRSVMIWRWVLLLRAIGSPLTLATASHIFLVSSFVGSFLPAGVGGDAARAWSLARHTATRADAVASVAVDRLLGLLSLAVMGVAGLAAWSSAAGDVTRVALSVALLGAACLAVFWSDRLLRAVVPAHHYDGPLAAGLLQLADAVGHYRRHRGTLVVVLLWSLAVQVLRITQAYYLGEGLGLDVPFSYYLLFMPVGLLLLLLPVSVSGFGVPQGAIVWLLAPAGVPATQAFALSTLIILTGLAGNLPGLILWLGAGSGTKPPADVESGT